MGEVEFSGQAASHVSQIVDQSAKKSGRTRSFQAIGSSHIRDLTRLEFSALKPVFRDKFEVS